MMASPSPERGVTVVNDSFSFDCYNQTFYGGQVPRRRHLHVRNVRPMGSPKRVIKI